MTFFAFAWLSFGWGLIIIIVNESELEGCPSLFLELLELTNSYPGPFLVRSLVRSSAAAAAAVCPSMTGVVV